MKVRAAGDARSAGSHTVIELQNTGHEVLAIGKSVSMIEDGTRDVGVLTQITASLVVVPLQLRG